MAIVKNKYVRGKARIKAHLRYITHRRGMEGERMSRPLFGGWSAFQTANLRHD